MNVFEVVKENLTVRKAAESYGMHPNRIGLIKCIFHNDKTPSMKVDERYYCFGCQSTGDVIDFATKLFGMRPVNAAMKLADDFSIPYDYARGSPKKIQKPVAIVKKTEPTRDLVWFVRTYLDYLNLLRTWKEKYSPKTTEEEWDKHFVLSLEQIPVVEYYLDILLFGETEDKNSLMREKKEELVEIERKYFS